LWVLFQCIRGYDLAQQYPEYLSSDNHDGIVIVHENIAKKCFYGDGVILLINTFRAQKPPIPYKVYHCENLQKFIEVVRNPKITSLWIFGHGRHWGIGCGVDSLSYEETFLPPPVTPEKQYVYQFHCNSGCGKSLANILSHDRGFANYRDTDYFTTLLWLKQIIKKF